MNDVLVDLGQADIIRRAASEEGVRVATPEDLLVMKLIADRPKDRVDLAGLAALPDIDWEYAETRAEEWAVAARLRALRAQAEEGR